MKHYLLINLKMMIPKLNAVQYLSPNVEYIGCSFKFLLKVGVEESIVYAPRITDRDHGSAV
jgi:hypothetical protein